MVGGLQKSVTFMLCRQISGNGGEIEGVEKYHPSASFVTFFATSPIFCVGLCISERERKLNVVLPKPSFSA